MTDEQKRHLETALNELADEVARTPEGRTPFRSRGKYKYRAEKRAHSGPIVRRVWASSEKPFSPEEAFKEWADDFLSGERRYSTIDPWEAKEIVWRLALVQAVRPTKVGVSVPIVVLEPFPGLDEAWGNRWQEGLDELLARGRWSAHLGYKDESGSLIHFFEPDARLTRFLTFRPPKDDKYALAAAALADLAQDRSLELRRCTGRRLRSAERCDRFFVCRTASKRLTCTRKCGSRKRKRKQRAAPSG
jgi:hypothetical protein